jgi:hypothetical protein
VECSNDGKVIYALEDGTVCALNNAPFPIVFLLLVVDFVDMIDTDEMISVPSVMIERSLTGLPEMVIDGDNMIPWAYRNVDVCTAVSN